MSIEMAAARERCYQMGKDFLNVWEFERTPPSPRPANADYLDAVAHSDVVIWLLAGSTSEAVCSEVELALEKGKSILAFRFPAARRDRVTTSLFSKVRRHFKTADVEDVDDLEIQLGQALSDEIARRFRAYPHQDRTPYVAHLHRHLSGLAISRWQAVGMAREAARKLLDDSTVGSLPSGTLPSGREWLTVLEGDIGSGKTLAAIRFLRSTIGDGTRDSGPIPVWLDGTDRFETIESAIDSKTATSADYRVHGVTLVVDGLDELTEHSPLAVIDECRALLETLPDTRVLITSRPLLDLAEAPERRVMPSLTRQDAAVLIERAFAVRLEDWELGHYPRAIIDAVTRPLFALLLGRSLASRRQGTPRTMSMLFVDLAKYALRDLERPDDVAKGLAQLARRATEADGASVPTSEFESAADVRQLVRTRLVVDTGGALVFALPVLREWFAAQAILSHPSLAARLAGSERTLERWRQALGIALGIASRQDVDAVMKAVTRRSPAFGSQLIPDKEPVWERLDQALALPDARSLGRQYRRAMRALLVGLGPISDVLAPSRTPRLPTLGVRLELGYLVAAWEDKPRGRGAKIVDLPAGDSIRSVPRGWTWLQISAADPDPLWPWRKARDELRSQMQEFFESRSFVVNGEAMHAELVWRAAVAIAKRGSHDYRDIPSDKLRKVLRGSRRGDAAWTREGPVPLRPLLDELKAGKKVLECPYPGRDRPMGGWIWDGFSDETLATRTRLVYETAIAIYDDLVSMFLPTLRPRLTIATLMPFALVGTLQMPGEKRSPGLAYHLAPLGRDKSNEVRIELGPDRDTWDTVTHVHEQIRRLRPDVAPWAHGSVTKTGLDVFGVAPATTLAYRWLSKELAGLGWLERAVH